MTSLEVSLQIFRYKAGESPHYDTYTVQVADTAYVIDAIDAAWVHDHSLTYRRACHHSSCGTCGTTISLPGYSPKRSNYQTTCLGSIASRTALSAVFA